MPASDSRTSTEDQSDLSGAVRPPRWKLLPGQESVQAGQSDKDVALLLATWTKHTNRALATVVLRYAGILRATGPKGDGLEAKIAWEATCTPRQQGMLALADAHYLEERRAEARAIYKRDKAAAGLGAVREYVTGLSPEKHAERTRTKGAEKRKRFSENKKLAGPDTLKPEIAEALDDALAALPDLGGMRIGKAKLAAMSPEERVARRKLQKAQSAKRSRSSKKFEADK